MDRIKPTNNEHHWPRHEVKSIECRKRDLVIRIADWSKDRDEPSFEVEVYVGGVYDWNESKGVGLRRHRTKEQAKRMAVEFAQAQIAKLL